MNSERPTHVGPISLDLGGRKVLQPTILSVVVAKVSGNGNFMPLLCSLTVGDKVVQFKQALNL